MIKHKIKSNAVDQETTPFFFSDILEKANTHTSTRSCLVSCLRAILLLDQSTLDLSLCLISLSNSFLN